MSIPAGRTRRSHIQWHDGGSAQRVRGFRFLEDASPLRALGLAAILGIFSIAVVVAVIQFQRSGGFGEVSTSIVDEARASPDPHQGKTVPAAEPFAAVPAVKAAAAETAPPAEAVQEQPAPEVVAVAPSPEPESEKAESVTALPAPEMPIAVATAARYDQSARDKIAAILADEKQQALEPLTENDPRWQAVETAAIATPQQGVTDESNSADASLAFAPVEMPPAVPLPEPAPRQKKKVVAAVETEPEPVSPAALANAKVRSAVFLRSRPADGSKVIVTIPRGSAIQVSEGCRHWCAVTYEGKRGFVYKSFVSR